MKYIRYIVWLLPLLLSSCDFFYSTVTYTGPEADPHLCVEARLTASPDGEKKRQEVYVTHSAFFLDNYNGTLMLVPDAWVGVQVNRDQPVYGKYVVSNFDTYSGKLRSGGYYEYKLALSAGDSVLLSVEHPTYGKAEAVQVCPSEQPLTVTVDSISRYGEIYGKMHLSGYQGSPTDVVTFIPRVDKCQARLTYERGALTQTDTVIVFEADSVAVAMYSPDDCFARYQDKRSQSGYYAGYSLTLPVSAEEYEVPIILDSHMFGGIVGKNGLSIDYMFISIRTEVRTIEDYDYYTSLAGVLNRSDYVPPLSSQMEDEQSETMEYMEAVIESIREAFDELGNVEESQIYGNLYGEADKPPIGCFSLVNVCEHILKVSTDPNIIFF